LSAPSADRNYVIVCKFWTPWTDFRGRDHHLLRPETAFDEQRGNGGGGVQVEGVLSYFIRRLEWRRR
ncbi:hypothetical protein, partial [Bradyrhizobium elkanii]|uniref:hypothetical protein n=1 Tax=Bradyrhizobium elkanii TaxID=29448 RepID=UPI001143A813